MEPASEEETSLLLQRCCRIGVRYPEIIPETEQIEIFALSACESGREALDKKHSHFTPRASLRLTAWHQRLDPILFLPHRMRIFAEHIRRSGVHPPPAAFRAIQVRRDPPPPPPRVSAYPSDSPVFRAQIAKRCRFADALVPHTAVAVAMTFGLEEETLRYASRKRLPCTSVFIAFRLEVEKLRKNGAQYF